MKNTDTQTEDANAVSSTDLLAGFNFEHGTEQQHRDTLQRAEDRRVSYIWSGDLRNMYLMENLDYGQAAKLISVEFVDDRVNQETGFKITYIS